MVRNKIKIEEPPSPHSHPPQAKIWPVHRSSSLLLLPPHTFPCFSVSSPQATVPSRNCHQHHCGGEPQGNLCSSIKSISFSFFSFFFAFPFCFDLGAHRAISDAPWLLTGTGSPLPSTLPQRCPSAADGLSCSRCSGTSWKQLEPVLAIPSLSSQRLLLLLKPRYRHPIQLCTNNFLIFM